MHRWLCFSIPLFAVLLLTQTLFAQKNAPGKNTPQKLDLQHADLLEVIFSEKQDTTVAFGSVSFQTESGTIICDSAVWVKGRAVRLIGSVVVEDTAYRLISDTVNYDLRSGVAIAKGKYVELYSRMDSLFAVGTWAYYDRPGRYFRMEHRPTMYLNYPDTAQMVEVVADTFEYDADDSLAVASGNTVITSPKVEASAGRAQMKPKGDRLDLYDNPVLKRGLSIVRGKFISVTSRNDLLERIDVTDSARAEFKEPVDSGPEPEYDQSILTGSHIVFDFKYGTVHTITSTGQSYSWYYPAARGSTETNENSVSGDTIRFELENDRLKNVTVIGGAVGTYMNTKMATKDTVITRTRDTVSYNSQYITYDLQDSTITLLTGSHVTSGTVVLDAHRVVFDTHKRIIRAYSANVVADSSHVDSTFTARFQPNPIPVRLKDKDQELYGDFLEYSIDTQKGRIVQSKSAYQTGYYYGDQVYRAQKDVFYVEDGRYTTCDADEPHFHFYSNHMKLIENDKLVARPVVLYIGRLPILALPYYVFPLKKGRHSGILPFRIGNLEQGNRYIENLGYYWAPSDYTDAQASLSYFTGRDAVTASGQFRYKKLYLFDGLVSGNLTKETNYNSLVARESNSTRWTLRASHSHHISPTFMVDGTGQWVSDKTYYKDYSADLRDRLNNNIVSRLNWQKRFSKQVSLSGAYSHTVYLEAERRIDRLENLGLSLPTIKPFGNGSLNDEGQLVSRWYQVLSIRPFVSATYTNERNTVRSFNVTGADTTFPVDSAGNIVDTVITPTGDSLIYRSRRKFAAENDGLGIDMPLTIARYIKVNPSLSYTESWVYLFRTDQTERLKLGSSGYRSYLYRTGVSASTDLYGTVYPNMFGMTGFRQTLTPTISYAYTPKIIQHPDILQYTGAGQSSGAVASVVSFSLRQLYQAKIKHDDKERGLDLLSINSSTGYNFEDTLSPWSDLTTQIQSSVLPKITLNGTLTHSFYKPGTRELHLLSPYLLSFNMNASITLAGRRFFFDEPEAEPALQPGADSASHLATAPRLNARQSQTSQGWSVTASYAYSESGRGSAFRKTSFLQFGIRFNLTPTTTVSYSQYYDFAGKTTINNQINIVKQLHCWTGQIYWVPIGSNRGYGFQLYVSAIPALKIDNSSTGRISGNIMQNLP